MLATRQEGLIDQAGELSGWRERQDVDSVPRGPCKSPTSASGNGQL